MQLGLHPLYRLYETEDGWLCLAAVTAEHWHSLLGALDPPWATDDRFVDAAARAVNAEALTDLLAAALGSFTARDLFERLDAHGVPCEIADPEFSAGVFDDPELRARGLVVQQQHPTLGRFEHFGTTIDFSDTPGRIWGPPPLVGQHTREIMHEYGFDDTEIDKLVEVKAVFEELSV